MKRAIGVHINYYNYSKIKKRAIPNKLRIGEGENWIKFHRTGTYIWYIMYLFNNEYLGNKN